MARIRSIHPGFFTDERLVGVSIGARLLFLGLGVEADDKGIFEWKPLTLKMRIFPADSLDVTALLSELEAADAIASYEIEGRKYGAIRNFRKFQRPKTPNDLYVMPDHFRKYVGLTDENSETQVDKKTSFPRKGEKSPQMEDGGGRRESSEDKSSGASAPDLLGQVTPLPPADDKAKLFQIALPWLMHRTAKTRDQVAKLLGSWCKAHSAAEVLSAVARAQADNAIEPIGFITAILKPKPPDEPERGYRPMRKGGA